MLEALTTLAATLEAPALPGAIEALAVLEADTEIPKTILDRDW